MTSGRNVADRAGIEQKALRISIVGYLLLGILAVVFALYSQSEAILLDGFFNLVSFVMSIVTLHVAKLLLRPPEERFQYGYMPFEPFVNTVKGLILFVVCGFALVSSVDALIDGGRELSAVPALIYSIIATAGCIVVMLVQKRIARGTKSPLLDLDIKSWKISAAISSAVACGFITAVILDQTGFSHVVPYIDPLMVIILVAAMIKMPISAVKEGVTDLFLGAPAGALQTEIRGRITKAIAEYSMEQNVIRMVKVGRHIFVTTVIVVAPGTAIGTVGELDAARETIAAAIEGVHPFIIVDVLFTGDERWLP